MYFSFILIDISSNSSFNIIFTHTQTQNKIRYLLERPLLALMCRQVLLLSENPLTQHVLTHFISRMERTWLLTQLSSLMQSKPYFWKL